MYNKIYEKKEGHSDATDIAAGGRGCRTASTGTQSVPVSSAAGFSGHRRGGAVQSQELHRWARRLLALYDGGTAGISGEFPDCTADALPRLFSAAAGVLVRIGVLLVADLRRRERVHPPQPYDALHRGGSDGV